MKKTVSKKKIPIEKVEEMAVRGDDVTHFFSGKGQMKPGFAVTERVKRDNVQRVNVDFNHQMLSELDEISEDLNVPRQSIIKTMLREAMDRYYQNKKSRRQA